MMANEGREVTTKAELSGVIPANLMTFDSDLEIDEVEYRHHLRDLIETRGVTAITTVAHASEVASLTDAEQQRTLAIAVEEAAGKVSVISGVYDTGNARAVARAKMAEREGADALLVFPSSAWDMGHQQRPEMAYSYIADIAESTSLPVIVFVYPVTSGLHIPTQSLVRICAEVENVAAIKEWSNDIVTYERNFRELKALDKEISVLSSFSKALLPSLCVGADGILSGHGSMIASLHVELFEAVQAGDLANARSVAERIYPITKVIYDDPFVDGHNRMKEALAILGRIAEARVRPPLQPISAEERGQIEKVVLAAGLSQGDRAESPA
jgi:4-hydroxy-tetrahydrodipicolinate synthase